VGCGCCFWGGGGEGSGLEGKDGERKGLCVEPTASPDSRESERTPHLTIPPTPNNDQTNTPLHPPKGPTEPLLQAMVQGEALPASTAADDVGGAGYGNGNGGGGDDDDDTEPLPGDIHYPWLERKLQNAYRQHVSGFEGAAASVCVGGTERLELD